ncbi:MAG: HNH endonuclease [Bacteroidota bacterium]
MMQVLVLNQDYQAISLCDPERATVLVLSNKAELVADVASRKMRSIRQEFAFPSVIRLQAYVNLPYKKISLTRQNLFKRDGNRCVYCDSTERLTVDHLIPRAKGGRTIWNNLVTACHKCNARKGDLSVQDAGLSLRHEPFRPSFIMFLSKFSGNVQDAWKPYLLMA